MPSIVDPKERFEIMLVLPWRYFLTGMVLWLALTGVLLLLRQQGLLTGPGLFAFVLVALAIFLPLYLAHRIATAKVAMIIDAEGVHQVWLQQFAFDNRPDRRIRWEDIVDYKFEPGYRGKDWFMATLRDETVWRLYRYASWSLKQDDFYAFRRAFNEQVKQYNQNKEQKESQIGLARTFTQSRTAFVAAILLTGLIAAFPVVLVVLYIYDSPATAAVGIFGGLGTIPALLFTCKVYQDRAKWISDK